MTHIIRKTLSIICITTPLLLLSACQTTAYKADSPSISPTIDAVPANTIKRTLKHTYDTVILNSASQRVLNIQQLAQKLKDRDVIFIGEFHGNQASHLLQMQLQTALFELRPQQILSMEMFNRDQQTVLNRYLDDEIGEKYLINEAPTWPNYAGSYRPMVEFAKQHFIPVIAANASADIVRCIGSYGKGYETLLPQNQRQFIAEQPYLNDDDYQQKFYNFMDSMRKITDKRKANSYAAQLARDNTMAESILMALKDNAGSQVIHLNGSFHSESSLGTVALLKQRDPNLKISVITPIRIDLGEKVSWSDNDLALGDYLYFVSPQPTDYRNAAYKMKARQAQFANSKQKTKQCYAPNVIH